MVVLDPGAVREALNGDPEFRLAARYWDVRLRLSVGERAFLVRVVDGEVVGVDDAPTPFDAYDVELGGTEEHWDELLRPVPEPFYQDIVPAVFHHGMTMGGDLESLFAYHPAVRWMLDVLRAGAAAA